MGNSNSGSVLDNILNDNIFTKVNISNKDIYYISDDKFTNVVSALENYYNEKTECNKSMLSQDFKYLISKDLSKYDKNGTLNGAQGDYLKNRKTINDVTQSLFRRLNSECNLSYGGNIQGGSNRVGGKRSKKNKKSKSKKTKSKKSKSKKNKK